MANIDAVPTPITPAWVPIIDPKTGLISQAWYLFFLSLFRAAEAVYDNQNTGPSAISLAASLEEALNKLTQEVQTQPISVFEQVQPLLEAIAARLDTLPPVQPDPRIDALQQEFQTLPRPELGSMAPLEQDNLPWVTFNTAPSPLPTTVGTVAWDGGTTLGVQATTDVVIRVGEAEYVYVKASSAISKGQLAYHTGSVGASGVITVAPTPLALSDPNQIVGVAAETIALNGFGLIQVSGTLRGFNTTGTPVGETWADGDALYYNPAYVGSMTKVKPSAPNQKTYMGEVISAATAGSGSMSIRIVPGSILGGTDSNVQFGTLSDKDLIQYDNVLGYWKNIPGSTYGTGSVTSVGLSMPSQFAVTNSPVTTSGTLTAAWNTQTANYVLAGPTTGSAAAPTFRALVAADIPSLSYVTSVSVASSNGLAGTSSGGTTPTLTLSTSVTGLVYGNGTALAAATISSPLAYSAGTLSIPVATSSANGYLSSTDWSTFNAKQAVAAPVTKTADFIVASTDIWLINNKSGSTCTVTLPAASSNSGRVLYFLNYQAYTVVSASSNVVALTGGAAGTAILAAVAGDTATLVSDGTNWIMTQYVPNNVLLLE